MTVEHQKPVLENQLLERTFVPLYQAAKHKQAVLGEVLDYAIFREDWVPNLSEQSEKRYALVQKLNQTFDRLGVGVTIDTDQENRENGQYTLYRMNFPTAGIDTMLFLKVALWQEAHLIKPERISDQDWARWRNITGLYYGTGLSQEKIGHSYGVTKERVRQLIKLELKALWDNCTTEVQYSFPFAQLEVGKPPLARGGISASIAQLVKAGKTLGEVKAAGFTTSQIISSRRTLKSWDVEVPYKRKRPAVIEDERLFKALSETADLEQLQKLLREMTLQFAQNNSRGEDPLLLTVDQLVKEQGFHYHRGNRNFQYFMEALEQQGIPVASINYKRNSEPPKGIRNYHYILTRYQERARQVLLQDSNLQRFLINPVVQICGEPQEVIPSTSVFAKGSESYRGVASLFKSLGAGPMKGPGNTYEKFFAGCPVPIFKLIRRHQHIYPVDQEPALKEFIQNQIKTKTTL